jgi:predicted RND superfamily exporter protein
MWQQLAAASAMSLLDNKLKTSERSQAQRYATMMSNSAHQRQMADMRKAGLNPILSGKYGGASTPSVAQAPVGVRTPEFMQKIASAKQSIAQIPKIREEIKTIKQTREFNEVIHKERWQKLASTMGADNVIATAIATLNGMNLGELIQQKPTFISRKQFEGMVKDFMAYKSTIGQETSGIENTAKRVYRAVDDKARKIAKMINNYMDKDNLFIELRESLNK